MIILIIVIIIIILIVIISGPEGVRVLAAPGVEEAELAAQAAALVP